MRLPTLTTRPARTERPSTAVIRPTDLGLGAVARDVAEVEGEMRETKRIETEVLDAEAEERARPLLQEVAASFEADFAERGARWDGITPGFARETNARFDHFFGPFGQREDLDPATQAAVTRGVNQARIAAGQRAAQYEAQRRGGVAAQQARATEAAAVGGRMGDYLIGMAEARGSLDREWDGSTTDYADRLVAAHDQVSADVLAATPEALRPVVAERLAGQRVQLVGQGLDVQARGTEAYVAGQVKGAGAALVNSVIGAPGTWQSARGEVDALVGALPAGMRGATRASLLDDLGTAYVDGLIAEGREDEAIELLTSGALDGDLSPDNKARALERAQRAADELDVGDYVTALTLEGSIDDNLASLRMTGVPVEGAPTVEQVAAAQGPAAAAKYAIELEAASRAGQNRPAFAQMSEGQIGAWVEAQAPVPGQPGYADAQALYEQNARLAREEIADRKDPAAWALRQAPPLGARLTAGLQGDKAMARDYAVGALALQAQAGIAPQNRRILPETTATGLVARIEGGDPREGLLTVGATIAAFAPPSGAGGPEAWAASQRQRMVANELVAAGLDPAMLAAGVDLTGNEAAMAAFVRAQRGGGLGALERDQRRGVETGVARELAPYLASFQGGGVSGNLTDGRRAMTELIAADLVARGRRPDAAAREAAAIVTGPYEFVGQQGVRVPRQQVDGRGDESRMTRGMSRIVQTHLVDEGALLRIPNPPEWRDLSEEQRRDRWTDTVATQSRWFTTPDEAGAVLMVRSPDGRWDPVVAVDGAPVAYRWNQFKVAGNDAGGDLGGNPFSGRGRSPTTSSTAAPRGIRNHNPGNLRPSGDRWQGQAGVDRAGGGPGFVRFETPAHGIRALAIDLSTKHGRGLRSVRQIIGVYAPPSENDTAAYVANVARALGVDPDAPLDFSGPQLEGMMAAVIQMENGQQPYPQSMLQEGARQARTRR